MSDADIKLFAKAALFSAQKHSDQRRKDAAQTPYINHPMAVANILCQEAGVVDINILCAALLHDTIEDTDTCFEELQSEFNSEIATIVMELTDDKMLEKHQRKQKQIESGATKSRSAKLVKIADKTSNLRDLVNSPPQSWSENRLTEYRDWAKQVVDQMGGVHPVLEAIFDQAYVNANSVK